MNKDKLKAEFGEYLLDNWNERETLDVFEWFWSRIEARDKKVLEEIDGTAEEYKQGNIEIEYDKGIQAGIKLAKDIINNNQK